MPSPVLEQLLILQDRDSKRLALEAQLKAVPREIALVEARIAAEKAAIDAARAEARELEVKKKGLENDIGSLEQQLGRYKTQQLSVRKNDEYAALGHEIETTQGKIGALEEQELEVMFAIDEAKKKFAAAEATLKANIADHESRIRTLRERDANLTAELTAARTEVESARATVAEPARRLYDRIAPRHMPAVVPLREGKCGGCHLKVSSEVESAARGKTPEPQLPTCDQCGRIVYKEV